MSAPVTGASPLRDRVAAQATLDDHHVIVAVIAMHGGVDLVVVDVVNIHLALAPNTLGLLANV